MFVCIFVLYLIDSLLRKTSVRGNIEAPRHNALWIIFHYYLFMFSLKFCIVIIIYVDYNLIRKIKNSTYYEK